jgi:hypothetical protein
MSSKAMKAMPTPGRRIGGRNTAEPDLKSFIDKAATAEGKILNSLVTVGVTDLAKNGFTTAGFVATGKDILAQLVAQNISTFSLQEVMVMLNIKAAPVVAAAARVEAPSEAAPAESAPVV